MKLRNSTATINMFTRETVLAITGDHAILEKKYELIVTFENEQNEVFFKKYNTAGELTRGAPLCHAEEK